jgi:hypothetical protein
MLARAGQQRGYSTGHRGAAGATARRRAVSDYDPEKVTERLAGAGRPRHSGAVRRAHGRQSGAAAPGLRRVKMAWDSATPEAFSACGAGKTYVSIFILERGPGAANA